MKILLDTSVWISYFGQRKEKSRISVAESLFRYFDENEKIVEICYSERTLNELESNDYRDVLKRYSLVVSHILDLNWEEIDLKWENIHTKWGDSSEVELGDDLKKELPDNKHKSQKADRGIYGDAILEECNMIIHENPKDFNKLQEDASKRGIEIINLLDQNESSIIELLEQFKNDNSRVYKKDCG